MRTKRKVLFGAALLVTGLAVMALRPQNAPLETVPSVDLQKYMGTWYEIAAFPQRFQKGCQCTKAEYSLHPDGYVEVRNSCRKNGPDGKLKAITGKAFVADKTTNAKLKVQFFWPFKGDYWILDLAPDYSYAVVGAPDRESLWILARKPVMAEETYQQILGRIKEKNFDVSRLKLTNQECR
ncbi:lipocalin family protein [Adhaeribacter soli]|uniref:Lipocalin family protein n=1 Tax=Adhaeribacter soli TaxID=2607655 RepID=A0A5N1IIY9_9BACT|nr:lipocalin family protein [Adhaeribacter soli]KAA9325378.1 lipocalin family protein [Adhaeribacter soli]